MRCQPLHIGVCKLGALGKADLDWPPAKIKECDVIAVGPEGEVGRARYRSADRSPTSAAERALSAVRRAESAAECTVGCVRNGVAPESDPTAAGSIALWCDLREHYFRRRGMNGCGV